MKSGLLALSLVLFSPLWLPYGSFVPSSPGNRDWSPYVGDPSSTYDVKANPPQTIGTVSYNPLAPLASVAPATPSGSDSGPATPAR